MPRASCLFLFALETVGDLLKTTLISGPTWPPSIIILKGNRIKISGSCMKREGSAAKVIFSRYRGTRAASRCVAHLHRSIKHGRRNGGPVNVFGRKSTRPDVSGMGPVGGHRCRWKVAMLKGRRSAKPVNLVSVYNSGLLNPMNEVF